MHLAFTGLSPVLIRRSLPSTSLSTAAPCTPRHTSLLPAHPRLHPTISTPTPASAPDRPHPRPRHVCVTARALPASHPAKPTVLSILSTIVGICVLIGSVLYKIPQVFRVVRRKSAAGISVLMYALETLGTTFSAVYFARRAFPFSTYGETVFIMVQNVLLMALIVFYEKLPRIPAFIVAALYASMLLCLYSPLVPLRILVVLQVCSIPILNLARVPQILLNWRRKSTGELSPITLGLQLLGNVARIFTTIAQVRDPLMFGSVCIATCFNSTLFFQWIYYRKQSKVHTQIPNA